MNNVWPSCVALTCCSLTVHTMTAIPPGRFYDWPLTPTGIPYPITLDPWYSVFTMDNSINPQLWTDGATGIPASESLMVYAQNPALPPSPSTEAIETLKRKDFSKIEIEKLLWAVLNINPYMAPWRQVMTYWKAFSQELHDDDTCLDCCERQQIPTIMCCSNWAKRPLCQDIWHSLWALYKQQFVTYSPIIAMVYDNCTHEVLKNKVMQLLAWVDVRYHISY